VTGISGTGKGEAAQAPPLPPAAIHG